MGLTQSVPTPSPSSPPAPDRSVLAIDAGNSKTDVALVGPDGSVLGAARGGGFRPPVVGAERAVGSLAPLVAALDDLELYGEAAGEGGGALAGVRVAVDGDDGG
ncbi:hypothetical protein AB0G58_37640, partial [Streptomyces sp. NPDC022067]